MTKAIIYIMKNYRRKLELSIRLYDG